MKDDTMARLVKEKKVEYLDNGKWIKECKSFKMSDNPKFFVQIVGDSFDANYKDYNYFAPKKRQDKFCYIRRVKK